MTGRNVGLQGMLTVVNAVRLCLRRIASQMFTVKARLADSFHTAPLHLL